MKRSSLKRYKTHIRIRCLPVMASYGIPNFYRPKNNNWDRFIRSREKIYQSLSELPYRETLSNVDALINKKLHSTSEEIYKSLLVSALGVTPPPKSWKEQWPVRPRFNPHIGSPSAVLDLPSLLNDFIGNNMVDWSSTNYLTVAFPRSAYLWHADTNQTFRFPYKDPSCLKWNPDGTFIFIASKNCSFKFIDAVAKKEVTAGMSSPCHLGCYITSCDFHPKSPIMFIGCSKGTLSVFYINKGMHIITYIEGSTSAITNIGFSIDGKHLAVANMSEEILVYDTVQYYPVFSVKMTAPSRAIAWHPWKRSYLVTGDSSGFMALCDVTLPVAPKATYYTTLDSGISCLTFNSHSAELVVSHRVYNNPFYQGLTDAGPVHGGSQLNVLASFERVVDRLEGHIGNVPFLCWNPDGTQLVSAGSDETARIWNFLPKNKQPKPIKTPRKMNYSSAAREFANQLGLGLR